MQSRIHLNSQQVLKSHQTICKCVFPIPPPGEMLLRSGTLNSQICLAVVAHTPSLRSPASEDNPFGSFDYLTVYHPEQRTAVMELLSAVEKGRNKICRFFLAT